MTSTRIQIPMVGGSYQHDSRPFDSQLTVNLFPEIGGKQSNSPSIFRRTPGLDLFTIVPGTGPIRGIYRTSDDRLFTVRNANFYEVDTSGTVIFIDNIASIFGHVEMSDNGLQLIISDQTFIYYYTFSTGILSIVTDTSTPDKTPSVPFIDGYTFGFDPESPTLGTFRHSNINDVSIWDALDVYTAEGSPDRLVNLKANNRELWVFGSQSYEVWYNAGGDNTGGNPTWARVPGSFKEIGLGAVNAVSTINGRIFWLGSSKGGANIVWTANGYQPIRISTRALESEISSFSMVETASSYTYEYQGHYFYVLNFNLGEKSFVYDITEGEWHNWASRNTITGLQGRHRSGNHAFFNRTNYVSDYANGNIYELSSTTYTDNGDPIVWERYFPYFENLKEYITWYMLQIDILVGSAPLAGQGSDPKIQLRWSDDGGYEFGHWHEMGIGKRGQYNIRVIKRLLGTSRNRVYHIRSSEPIPISIQDGTVAEIEAGKF